MPALCMVFSIKLTHLSTGDEKLIRTQKYREASGKRLRMLRNEKMKPCSKLLEPIRGGPSK
jgi:hypothetical protein